VRVLNFIGALEKLKIPSLEFIKETEAVHKLGFYMKGGIVIFII
jgi:hypothetical protein